jgi:DNA-directed RNA polymerase specialized sigma24 family protein
VRVTLDAGLLAAEAPPVDLEALDEALTRLEALDAELAQVVEVRFFGGLSIEEAAETLDVSPATVKRRWTVAKAWLARELGVKGRK